MTLDEAAASLSSTTDSNPKIDPPSPAAASQSGERLFPDWERFEIIDFLGAGGMGSVFKARDPRLQRLVAIKFMRVERLTGTEQRQRQRFLREAQAQARLDHPHICKMSGGCRNSDGLA
jgi:serine/threonine protein kinase